MKHKIVLFTFFFFTLISSNVAISAQNKKGFGEMGVGLFHVQMGAYRSFSQKSVVGVHTYTGFAFPAFFVQVSPQYKYYLNGITTKENKGSAVLLSGLNMMAVKDYHAGSDKKRVAGLYANAGIGYEWNLNKLIIRPTLSVAVPLIRLDKTDSYKGEMIGCSIYSSVFQTLSLSYRF